MTDNDIEKMSEETTYVGYSLHEKLLSDANAQITTLTAKLKEAEEALENIRAYMLIAEDDGKAPAREHMITWLKQRTQRALSKIKQPSGSI